jgi:RNase P subunit RPR2
MVDMAAIAGAASALKSAYDLSKAALSAHDHAVVRAKITEMQGEISAALASAITAQTEHMATLSRVRELEAELAERNAWDAERKRYRMERLPPGVLVYTLKEEMAEPDDIPHHICPTCYHRGKKSPLHSDAPGMGIHHLTCHECGTKLEIGHYQWPQMNYPEEPVY